MVAVIEKAGDLVALLAEGVDRNVHDVPPVRELRNLSPSSRRAWIEISIGLPPFAKRRCRPPRGGRG